VRQFAARLTPQAEAAGLRLMTLAADGLPELRPGQLILARVPGTFDPYLRRAYAPLVRGRDLDVALLVPASDSLLVRDVTTLDLLAPVGNGFTLEANTRRLLLVGSVAHLAPLIALAHEATRVQIAVTLLVEHPDAPADLSAFLGSLLPLDVEYQIAASLAPQWPALLRWCDQVCAAGDPALYDALRAAIAPSSTPAGFAQALVMPEAACGTGACLGCAVGTVRGAQLACVDGPVFDLRSLYGFNPATSQ